RPQRAVDHFIRWARDLADTKTKDRFYPEVDKKNLFKEGYIATPSSHSRGSTVDLTIIVLTGYGSGQEIDMGTSFDLFSLNSWPMSGEIAGNQRANRMLLRTLMINRGFLPYDPEWWNFTLKKELNPTTYFDFPTIVLAALSTSICALVPQRGLPIKSVIGANHYVRFTPESGHVRCNLGCPLWARSGHSRSRDHIGRRGN